MSEPNSILLAVVSAERQLASHLVLREARRHDPQRSRTIGVITKPDLAPAGSDNERKYINLAKNRESVHELKFGWYVLKNRAEGNESAPTERRDAEETRFLDSSNWASVSPLNRGVESLRKKLGDVLQKHIEKTLPEVTEKIKELLLKKQQARDQLGPGRPEPQDRSLYLHRIFDDFARLARDGVLGRYGETFFADPDPLHAQGTEVSGQCRRSAVQKATICAKAAQ